jgi:hypothetical protein
LEEKFEEINSKKKLNEFLLSAWRWVSVKAKVLAVLCRRSKYAEAYLPHFRAPLGLGCERTWPPRRLQPLQTSTAKLTRLRVSRDIEKL